MTSLEFNEGGGIISQYVTYSDIIQFGLLICAIVALYNSKKK